MGKGGAEMIALIIQRFFRRHGLVFAQKKNTDRYRVGIIFKGGQAYSFPFFVPKTVGKFAENLEKKEAEIQKIREQIGETEDI